MMAAVPFEAWRQAARPLLIAGDKAHGLQWREYLSCTVPHEGGRSQQSVPGSQVRLPRPLMQILENVACFRHDGRWDLMYRLAWRTLYENNRLLEDASDPDVSRATSMDRTVRRDIHKMHAFVRFRECVTQDGDAAYFAWFEPQHEIVRKTASFFVERFPNMRWTISTPDGAIVWDLSVLKHIDSASPIDRPESDVHEDLWRTYYRSICNVSRLNPSAMQREMPQHYWRNLPEAADIAMLVREGGAQFAARHEESDHSAFTTSKSVQRSLAQVTQDGEGPASCRRCEIWRSATQAVEGEGPSGARIMLVGEQPGEEEDLRGKPFVGPAGKILDAALAAAGLDRGSIFVTNAVKHFKWEPRGKRRLHKKPAAGEIDACHVWLEREIEAVKPQVIVALGASALRALLGLAAPAIEVARRQDLTHSLGAQLLASYHPSAILRADGDRAEKLRKALVEDLERAAQLAR